jgi:hypothetical protein
MTEAVRFSESISVRLPAGSTAFVQALAREGNTKQAEIGRQLFLEALKARGFDPAAIPARDAGTLYDSLEGLQRYAKVEGDQIKFVSYHDEHPGEGWLPVEHRDSEPFDPEIHWRLAPTFTIVDQYATPNRVIAEYRVVPKNGEAP